MNPRYPVALSLLTILLAGCAPALPLPSAPADRDALRSQVVATERAFARSMADRDFAAFSSFISDDAVFFSGAKTLRGKAEIMAAWKKLFVAKDAPFSWEPEHVDVLDSGRLALSTGPVRLPDGKLAGTFTSVWRQEAPGHWRIVFDKGDDACDCAAH